MYDAFQQVRQIVRQYPFVSMDTEFPGVVARPIGEFNTTSDYQYQVRFCFQSSVGFLVEISGKHKYYFYLNFFTKNLDSLQKIGYFNFHNCTNYFAKLNRSHLFFLKLTVIFS